MRNIIKSCEECPFFNTINVKDDNNIHICKLSSHMNYSSIIIAEEDNIIKTPDWCLLKKDDYVFSFINTQNENIVEIKEQSDKLNDLFNDIKNYSDPDIIKNENKIKELQDKLNDILNIDDNKFNNIDITDAMNDITKQLNLIEEASIKLQKGFLNLGKDIDDDDD